MVPGPRLLSAFQAAFSDPLLILRSFGEIFYFVNKRITFTILFLNGTQEIFIQESLETRSGLKCTLVPHGEIRPAARLGRSACSTAH